MLNEFRYKHYLVILRIVAKTLPHPPVVVAQIRCLWNHLFVPWKPSRSWNWFTENCTQCPWKMVSNLRLLICRRNLCNTKLQTLTLWRFLKIWWSRSKDIASEYKLLIYNWEESQIKMLLRNEIMFWMFFVFSLSYGNNCNFLRNLIVFLIVQLFNEMFYY